MHYGWMQKIYVLVSMKYESTLLQYVEIMFSKALNSKQIQAWSTYPILSEHAHISFFKKIISSCSTFPLPPWLTS